METANYSVFRKFADIGQAQELAILLKENGVDSLITDNSPPFDVTFSGNKIHNEVQLKIKEVDFEKAVVILEDEAESLLTKFDQDHYLYQFTNEELYEILLKPDEWSAFDYKLAQQILGNKGQNVNPSLLASLRKQRLEDLSKPEEGQKGWIFAGYFFSFLGGLLGLFIGWHLWKYKKLLPNGQKVYAHTKADRLHGRNIFIIGCIVFPIWLIIRFWSEI